MNTTNNNTGRASERERDTVDSEVLQQRLSEVLQQRLSEGLQQRLRNINNQGQPQIGFKDLSSPCSRRLTAMPLDNILAADQQSVASEIILPSEVLGIDDQDEQADCKENIAPPCTNIPLAPARRRRRRRRRISGGSSSFNSDLTDGGGGDMSDEGENRPPPWGNATTNTTAGNRSGYGRWMEQDSMVSSITVQKRRNHQRQRVSIHPMILHLHVTCQIFIGGSWSIGPGSSGQYFDCHIHRAQPYSVHHYYQRHCT